MHNFGVYAGDNQFVFEGDKPIVLIGGMNGRGKTTFLEAVLIALYGSNSFAYTESKYKSYAQYLRSFVNKSAEDKCCSVVLEFEIFNGDVERYVIKREWDTLTKKTEERIKVYKDGTVHYQAFSFLMEKKLLRWQLIIVIISLRMQFVQC